MSPVVPFGALATLGPPTLSLKAKRLMDNTVAATGIIATAPIMTVTA